MAVNNKYGQSIDISIQINKLRKEMIEYGLTNGLTNLETIKCSQELDKLLIKYQFSLCCKKSKCSLFNSINKHY